MNEGVTIDIKGSHSKTFHGTININSKSLDKDCVRLETHRTISGKDSHTLYLSHDEARSVAVALLAAVRENMERNSEETDH